MDILSKNEAKALGVKCFYSGCACKDGHDSPRYVSTGACLVCVKENGLRRKQADPEKYLASGREAYQKWSRSNEVEYRRKRRQQKPTERAAYSKVFRERHPERVEDSNRRHYAKNRDRIIACKKEYWRQNPDIRQAARMAYEARKQKAKGSYTAKDIAALKVRQSMLCNGCKCDLNISGYHVDHVMPLALGGSNFPENIQLLCASCNHRKSARHPKEWLKFLIAEGYGVKNSHP